MMRLTLLFLMPFLVSCGDHDGTTDSGNEPINACADYAAYGMVIEVALKVGNSDDYSDYDISQEAFDKVVVSAQYGEYTEQLIGQHPPADDQYFTCLQPRSTSTRAST